MPLSYVTTIDQQASNKLKKLHINAVPIVTSGSFFVQKLKEELVKAKVMLPDSQYDGIEEIYDKVMEAHYRVCELKLKEHPDALYTQWYQDGLQHAFERLMATKKSGENSCVPYAGRLSLMKP